MGEAVRAALDEEPGLALAAALEAAHIPILGTSPDAIDLAEDRERFRKMLDKIGHTLVVSAITEDETWAAQLTDATHVDRLNVGPLPTIALNWLQPHEGNIVDFLFRARAYQTTPGRLEA